VLALRSADGSVPVAVDLALLALAHSRRRLRRRPHLGRHL
jgi:hypothetical protein